jgi:hypothetical protein
MTGNYSRRPAESLSTRVLETVAEREGVETTDLPSRLYDVVDPDALDSVFTADVGHLTFPYCGYRITVHADGRIELAEREEPRDEERA